MFENFRFASQSEIYFYALSHHVKTTERKIYPVFNLVSSSRLVYQALSQILISIFYLLLENRTKKSRKSCENGFQFFESDFCQVSWETLQIKILQIFLSVINESFNSPFLIRLRVVLFVFSREPLHFLFSKQSS